MILKKKDKFMKKLLSLLCIVGVTMSMAHGHRCDEKDEKQKECKPPKEAIEVCVSQELDSICQVSGRHGDILEGRCKNTPDEKYFACIPNKAAKED